MFRPLSDWDGPHTPWDRRRSRYTFKASYSDTENLLDRELDYLDAHRVVLEADFREQDIRVDGTPRANARQPDFPGVRLAFDSVHGPLIYQTDTCEWWQHNVRSIALGLEALRAVDRYGITSRAQQYTGWKAIAGTAMGGRMSPEEAILVLAAAAGQPAHEDKVAELHRLAKAEAHPDRHGGNREAWDRVEQAAHALGLL